MIAKRRTGGKATNRPEGTWQSLLILDGADPDSHRGTITTLSRRFIKSELLPISVIKNYKLLRSRRTDADYGDFETIDRIEAEDSVAKAEEILDQINELRLRLIAEL